MFITALQNIRRHIKLQVTCGLGIFRVRGGEMITLVRWEMWWGRNGVGSLSWAVLASYLGWQLDADHHSWPLIGHTPGNTAPALARFSPPMMGGGQWHWPWPGYRADVEHGPRLITCHTVIVWYLSAQQLKEPAGKQSKNRRRNNISA